MKRRIAEKTTSLLLIFSFSAFVVLAQTRGFTIQISSFSAEPEARSMVAELQKKGVDAYWVKAVVPGKGVWYRVRIGRYDNRAEAKASGDKFIGKGLIKEFIVSAYDTPPTDFGPKEESIRKTTTAEIKEPERAKKDLPVSKNSISNTAKSAAEISVPSALKSNSESISESNTKSRPTLTSNNGKPAEPEVVANKVSGGSASDKVARDAAKELNARKESAPAIIETDLGLGRWLGGANATPAIATPAMADALTDVTINNVNWKITRRTAETDKNLRAVQFVDSMTGWAAGDAGALYRTTDGGKSWKPLLCGAVANINFIYFVDWTHGWMLGESGGKMSDGAEDETILLLTINGGRTWTRKPLPNVTSLFFIDSKNGWAVGKNATLLKTTDGGQEWRKIDSIAKQIGLPVESSSYNFGFSDIHFINAEHGWLIGNFYGRARNNIGGIFTTSDGGATWKRIPITLQTQQVSGRFTPGVLHSVRFTDENTGSVSGEMYDGEGRYFFALHTTNGGKTWDQFRTPSRATHSTQFLDVSNGWTAAFAPREGGADAVVYDTTLMRTDNGGETLRNDFIARGRRIRGVFFISPTKGWAVGDRGMILSYDEKSKSD